MSRKIVIPNPLNLKKTQKNNMWYGALSYTRGFLWSLTICCVNDATDPQNQQNQQAANQKSHAVYIKKLHPEDKDRVCHDCHPTVYALSGFESIDNL